MMSMLWQWSELTSHVQLYSSLNHNYHNHNHNFTTSYMSWETENTSIIHTPLYSFICKWLLGTAELADDFINVSVNETKRLLNEDNISVKRFEIRNVQPLWQTWTQRKNWTLAIILCTRNVYFLLIHPHS